MLFMVDKIRFGLWLQKEREMRGWTQSDLARATGKDRAVINKIESGGALPAVETFIAFSNALNYSPLVLLREAGLIPSANDALSPKKRQLMQLAEQSDEDAVDMALAVLETAWEKKKRK